MLDQSSELLGLLWIS